MTLAIAHRDRDDNVVLDLVRERQPPFSPEAVVADFAGTLMAYGITEVMGDRYGGGWVAERFRTHGISYTTSERPKTVLYSEFLPYLNSGRIELLDNQKLVSQLCGLERRTGRGTGRDTIDHPPRAHDDLINAAAGAVVLAVSSGSMRIPPEAMARARQRPGGVRMTFGAMGGVVGVPYSVSGSDMAGQRSGGM
jgi:hypothetical protein